MERVRALGEHGDINGEILVSIVTQHCPDHVDAVLLLKSTLKKRWKRCPGEGVSGRITFKDDRDRFVISETGHLTMSSPYSPGGKT